MFHFVNRLSLILHVHPIESRSSFFASSVLYLRLQMQASEYIPTPEGERQQKESTTIERNEVVKIGWVSQRFANSEQSIFANR